MDEDRFDTLTRNLTAQPTRRGALRLLVGGALRSRLATEFGLARLTPDLARAARKCPGTTFKCGGACIPKADCCVDRKRLQNGARYGKCGTCQDGDLVRDHRPCDKIDPQGCHYCDERTYTCKPLRNGDGCHPAGTRVCGLCKNGKCRTALGKKCGTECCGQTDLCCEPGEYCLPPCPSGQLFDPKHCQCCQKEYACETGAGIECCLPEILSYEGICTKDGCCKKEQVCNTSLGKVCCPVDDRCCNNVCTHIKEDTLNCGECGHVCYEGGVCRDGTCVCPETSMKCTITQGTTQLSACCDPRIADCCPDGSTYPCARKGQTCCPKGNPVAGCDPPSYCCPATGCCFEN